VANEQVRYAWAPITKSEKQDDGSVIVHGPAASSDADRDGQKLDPKWLAEAFPKWYAESGNIREQHDPKRAVGRAVGYTQDGETHLIAAHVVDPVAVAKVEAGVLQGFSVGIKNPIIQFGDPAAPNGTVVGGYICETSLADRPSNPSMMFAIAKADDAGTLQVVTDAHVIDKTSAFRKEAEAIVAAVDELGLDLTKADTADEPTQIDDARAAIAIVARLIRGEADSLATGALNECWDISNLLDAVRALRYFISSEEEELANKTEATVSKTDEPTTTSTTTDPTSTSSSKVDAGTEANVTKVDTSKGADVTDATTVHLDNLVKSDGFTQAITDAVTAATEPLLARLEKVENTPVPGGPVIARTAGDKHAARSADADQLRAEAADLIAKAEQTGDRTLAVGYRTRAEDLLAKADA
jgi:hypothetical protein